MLYSYNGIKELPLIVICGPTASGKTELSVQLAKRFHGEIVNADSRQIYRYMDIGTAKIQGGMWKEQDGTFYLIVDDVMHHLIDIVEPDNTLTLAQYQDLAYQKITEIYKRGHLPFIVGGTGLYIDAVAQYYNIPRVEPDWITREKLEHMNIEDLRRMLQAFNPTRAEQMNEADWKNPRRLIRAIEIELGATHKASQCPAPKYQGSGQAVTQREIQCKRTITRLRFNTLFIIPSVNFTDLDERINHRVDMMIEAGLIEETRRLLSMGYTYNLSSMSGIGYKQIGQYIKGDIGLDEAIRLIKQETRRYARRQLAWFRRNKQLNRVNSDDTAESLVDTFLSGQLAYETLDDISSGNTLSKLVYLALPPHAANPTPGYWLSCFDKNCVKYSACLIECQKAIATFQFYSE
jgi:tRNA dimethylallyltransferase